MLTTLRGGLNSFFVIFLLGLLVASFAIWGIGDIFRSSSLTVAEVGDTEISANDYLQAFQNRVQSYQAQFGPEFTTQQAIAFGVHQQVLGDLIRRNTLDEEARSMGLMGSNTRVIEEIQNMDAFKDPLGNFSRFNYDNRLRGAGLTAQAFESSVRLDLARMQLIDGVMAAKPVPPSLVSTLYKFRKEQREAEILTLTASSMANVPNPDEATLLAYYENNQSMFTAPEYRDLTIMELNAAEFAESMNLSEEDIAAAYDAQAALYQTPETRAVQVLVVSNRDEAQSVYDRVQAGESFTGVAMEVTGFTEDDLSLGDLDYRTLETDYNTTAAERVFDLAEGEITAPTQTLFGWHVFAVTAVNASITRSIEDVRDELVAQIAEERGLDQVYQMVALIEDELAAGADMDLLRTTTQLPVVTLEGVDHNGLNINGVPVAGALDRLDMIHEGFEKLTDDELELLETPEGGYYLVQVDSITPSTPRPYEDVKDEVRGQYISNERLRLAGEAAQAALEAVQNGTPMSEIASQFGAAVVSSGVLTRDTAATSGMIAPSIARLIFSLDENAADMERAGSGDGYVIAKLSRIIAAEANEDSADFQALSTRIASEIETDLLVQYQLAVQNSLGIEVNSALIQQMMTPDGVVLPGLSQQPIGQ